MVFLNQRIVVPYLGPRASKIGAYSVASVPGMIQAYQRKQCIPTDDLGAI